jgi:IMP cyclohydrolase
MEGYCSTGQSPQRAVVPVEEEEEEEEEEFISVNCSTSAVPHETFVGRANQEDALVWACGKMQRNAYRISVWKPEETPPLGRRKSRSEDNIKTDLKEKQDSQYTCNVTSWRVRLTIVSMETQQIFPFVLLTHVCACQQYNKY